MGIRTTVTLDDDVLERVRRESRTRGLPFRETLNELLREALLNANNPPQRSRFRVRPMHLGFRPELNSDCVESLLEYGEGPLHR